MRVNIGDICKIVSGGDKPNIVSENPNSEYRYPIYGNALDNKGLYGYASFSVINEPSVTISARGSNCGEAFFRSEPYVPIVRLLSLIPNKNVIEPRYLYYLIKNMHFKSTGSGQPQITIPQIANCKVDIFENLIQQNKIADILSVLDNKIELNNKINAELENMAKTLYDYWFVQFDFPDEKGKPYKSSGGKMVWNETLKREIPEGWNTAKLENSFQVVSDKAKKENIQHLLYAPIEVLPIKQMSFHNTAPIENAVSGLCKFEKGNILLSNRRVYFHKVCIAPFDGVTRDTVIVLKAINESTFGFDYQIINSEHFISYATKFSYGSEQPVFSWQDAKNYYYAKPNNETAKKYSNCVAPLINKVLEVQNELRELTKQRDELLPLLMNGQVSVS